MCVIFLRNQEIKQLKGKLILLIAYSVIKAFNLYYFNNAEYSILSWFFYAICYGKSWKDQIKTLTISKLFHLKKS